MTVTIEPGNIVVHSVACWIDHPDVKVWEVDCGSKYAEVIIGGGSEPSLILYKGERTKGYVEGVDRGTVVKFPTHPDGEMWFHFADGGRYSWFLIAVRESESVETVWAEIDTQE